MENTAVRLRELHPNIKLVRVQLNGRAVRWQHDDTSLMAPDPARALIALAEKGLVIPTACTDNVQINNMMLQTATVTPEKLGNARIVYICRSGRILRENGFLASLTMETMQLSAFATLAFHTSSKLIHMLRRSGVIVIELTLQDFKDRWPNYPNAGNPPAEDQLEALKALSISCLILLPAHNNEATMKEWIKKRMKAAFQSADLTIDLDSIDAYIEASLTLRRLVCHYPFVKQVYQNFVSQNAAVEIPIYVGLQTVARMVYTDYQLSSISMTRQFIEALRERNIPLPFRNNPDILREWTAFARAKNIVQERPYYAMHHQNPEIEHNNFPTMILWGVFYKSMMDCSLGDFTMGNYALKALVERTPNKTIATEGIVYISRIAFERYLGNAGEIPERHRRDRQEAYQLIQQVFAPNQAKQRDNFLINLLGQGNQPVPRR